MVFAAQWANNYENTAAADGTTMTPTLSGAGSNSEAPSGTNTAYSRLIDPGDIGSGNSSKFSTVNPLTGTRSHRFTQAAALRNIASIALSATKNDEALRFKFRVGSTPGTALGPVRIFADLVYGGNSQAFNLYVNTANKIYIADNYVAGGGFVNNTSAQSSQALTPGNVYVGVFRYDPTQNSATFTVFPLGSTTVAATTTMSVTTARPIGSYNIGINNSANAGVTFDIDDLLIGTGGAPPRNDIVNAAPTVALTGAEYRTVLVGGTISDLGFTATDSDGTIQTLTAAVSARPAGAAIPALTGSATGTGTSSAALTVAGSFGTVGTYKVTATATDSATAPGSATYTVDAYPPPNTNTILRFIDPGEFQQLGSVADPLVALSDGDTTTGVESPPSPVGKVVWIQSGPIGPTGISIRVSGPINGSGTLTRKVELFKYDKTTKVWEATLTFTTATAPQIVAVTTAALQAIPQPINRTGVWWKITDTIS